MVPTVAQENAAFNAIYPEIETLITEYVPSIFQEEVLAKLHSTQGRALVVRLIFDGLKAAEAVT